MSDATPNGFHGVTHILAVLDKSGSMDTLRGSVVSGFNEWLHDLQKSNPDDPLSIVLFDTIVSEPVVGVATKDVSDLDETRYVPGGMTSLYDAVVRAVRSAEGRVRDGDRALVVIVTDGQENSSKETTKAQMVELTKRLESRGTWTFTYLSASPEAFEDGAAMGVQAGNMAAYKGTPDGTHAAFANLRGSSASYLSSSAPQASNFYAGSTADSDQDEPAPAAPVSSWSKTTKPRTASSWTR